MKKLSIILAIFVLVITLSACDLGGSIGSIGKSDFDRLIEYGMSQGEFDTDEDGNHYYIDYRNSPYAIYIYTYGRIIVLMEDLDGSAEIYTHLDFTYGEFSKGFQVVYTYYDEEEGYDDYGYARNGIYSSNLKKAIISFNTYEGTTRTEDQEIASENAYSIITFFTNIFTTQIGIDFK
jgi:hypothetical protein